MTYRGKMRFSIKTEDENTKNQRILEEKIQIKKQQIRSEFETFELEQNSGVLTANELKFKQELDTIKCHQKNKLDKLSLLSSLLVHKNEGISESTVVKSSSIITNPDLLIDKLESLNNEHERIERMIENQVLSSNSIKAKIEEFIKENNFIKKKNQELKYLCNLSENRFKHLEVIRFNASTKEVRKLL